MYKLYPKARLDMSIYVYFSISKQETELYLINYSINGEDHKSPVKGCMNVTHSKRRLDSN